MKRENDISELILTCESSLLTVESKYIESLDLKYAPRILSIQIKHIINDLRTILDYLACEIRETNLPDKKPRDYFYFPIKNNKADFFSQLTKEYPNLSLVNPKLVSYLESIQPYNNEKFKWLLHLIYLDNHNKHFKLIEQTKTETKEVKVTDSSRSGSVSWNPSSVFFGNGVFIMGNRINPISQLPFENTSIKTTITTWVDFKFEELEISSLGFLKDALNGTKIIISSIKSLIKP